MDKNTSIKIKLTTLNILKDMAHPGQSIDGVIQDAIKDAAKIREYWKHQQSSAEGG